MVPGVNMQDTLQQRLEFVGLGAGVEARLAPIAESATRHLEIALERFNATLAATPSAARFAYGRERIEGEGGGLAAHWRALVAGRLDAEFAQIAMRTGQRHARIGVEPRWHVGSSALIIETLIKGVIRDGVAAAIRQRRGPLSLLGAGDPAAVLEATDAMADGLAALVSGMVVDLDLSLSGYVDKLRQDRQAEAEAQQSRLRTCVEQAGLALQNAAEGRADDALMRLDAPELAPLRLGTERLADRMIALVEDLEQASGAAATLAREALQAGEMLLAGREAQAEQGQALAAILAEAMPALTEGANDVATLTRRNKTMVRRCAKGQHGLETARLALDGVRRDADQQAALSARAEALGFDANVLAARLAADGSGLAGNSGLPEEVRALAQGLGQLAAQLRAGQAQAGRAVGDAVQELEGVGALVRRLGRDIEADLPMLAGLARQSQDRAKTFAEAAMLARQLEAALLTDRDSGVAAERRLKEAVAGSSALAEFATTLEQKGETEPEEGGAHYPAPDHAALAAHWHVL